MKRRYRYNGSNWNTRSSSQEMLHKINVTMGDAFVDNPRFLFKYMGAMGATLKGSDKV